MSDINIDVTVNNGIFSYSRDGEPFDGSVDINSPTNIIYRLTNTDGTVFLQPRISDDVNHDITSHQISDGGLTLTLVDIDKSTETICLQLQVKLPDGTSLYSPDPKIRDKN
ncbi:DP-EP family protein [uncultured Paraglaciecola sp.]|uniref:DP-EP family protein n=1 Tax=uncultured Paraglaciecola sp. TaxID=1765024 RepID=UPI0025DFE627|nr:DP-EP family protein [uncultured Paraglaciecola sp.]